MCRCCHKNVPTDYHQLFCFSFIQVDISKVDTLCSLLEALLLRSGGPDLKMDPQKLHPLICMAFVFCYLWSIGGNIIENNWDIFDSYVRSQFEDNGDAKVQHNLFTIYTHILNK